MDEIAFNLRWILFSVMALIPLAMSVLTVISLNPVTMNHYAGWITIICHLCQIPQFFPLPVHQRTL